MGQAELWVIGMGRDEDEDVVLVILTLYFPQGFWHIKTSNLGHVL